MMRVTDSRWPASLFYFRVVNNSQLWFLPDAICRVPSTLNTLVIGA